MAQVPPSPVEFIGERVNQGSDAIVFRDRGNETVKNLGSLVIPEGPHYTDEFDGYRSSIDKAVEELKTHEIRVLRPDGSESVLQPFSVVEEICEQVDAEYGATVTPCLQKVTENPRHKVPELDRDLVYAAYVSLSAGGAVVLPTSVGNIVGAASDRALQTMFVVKQRPQSKSGVVLTTMDEIVSMAEIPEGGEGLLQHMHDRGILTGSKLQRNEDHPLFKNQAEWSKNNSQFDDGTSMFVFLPGPYSDAVARLLAKDGILLTASSANKSGEGNNRDIATLHRHIKTGTDLVAWDRRAIKAYPLDEALESQGVMVDFRPYGAEYLHARERFNDILEQIGETEEITNSQRFHIIRSGFLQGQFMLQAIDYIARHPELGITRFTGDIKNIADQNNKLAEKLAA